jgi:hypothetical protein
LVEEVLRRPPETSGTTARFGWLAGATDVKGACHGSPASLVLQLPEAQDAPVALGVVTVLAVLVLMAPIPLTACGARRRGRGLLAAFLSGLVFPFTWAAWYLVDEPLLQMTTAQ